MKHGSLFSGIGGFDLAAEWMGWENMFSCEINPFGRRVLEYYWPNAEHYEDITTTDFTIWRGRIDILTGGFPCQPFSQAGKRKGTEDDRHLWPRMLEVIREVQPTWVVGENVYGLTNWDGGLVFEQVCLDLEAEGYEVQPVILPAASVNAPHRRDRVWFVAYSESNGGSRRPEKASGTIGGQNGQSIKQSSERSEIWSTPDTESQPGEWMRLGQREFSEQGQRESGGGSGEVGKGNVTDTERIGSPRKEYGQEGSGQHTQKDTGCRWADFPTQPPVCGRDDELSSRLDGITFPKWRNESIKAYGNAIVPQVAYEIFKVIDKMDPHPHSGDD
jgi:DNA (cytosine-5)-methyltransferase 1